MKITELSQLIAILERTQEEQMKISRLFGYEALDGSDIDIVTKERIRTDITIEFGGSRGSSPAHTKIGILTRKEHTAMLDAITSLLEARIIVTEKAIRQQVKSL